MEQDESVEAIAQDEDAVEDELGDAVPRQPDPDS
jgi:hypothetical protein